MNANLIALANGRLDITINKYDYKDQWSVSVRKDDDGINLRIESEGEDLDAVIDDVYEKWVKVTRSAPALALNMIEHRPPPAARTLDDETHF